MASNLPDGVTPNMIPGNRPEDIAHDRIVEGLEGRIADLRLVQLHEALGKLLDMSRDVESRGDAAADVVNFFADVEDMFHRGFQDWLSDVEDIIAITRPEEPPEPEWEPEYDYDY